MLLAALLIALAAEPADAGAANGPSSRQLAQLYFEGADLAKAVQLAQACVTQEGQSCRPLLVAIVEYQALANHLEHLTKAEATAFIAYDRQVNPTRPLAKLTRRVHQRFVLDPFTRAQQAIAAGQPEAARNLARNVLDVDPLYEPAKAMLGVK